MAITWQGLLWAETTPYLFHQRVVSGGNVYRATVAGISGTGTAPTGTGTGIVDGGVTWEYLGPNGGAVTDIAPELSTIDDPQRIATLDMVDLQVPTDPWDDLQDTGARFLAAHILTLSKLRGRSGPVTAEAVGGVSRSYGMAMLSRGSLGMTAYGIEYLRLVRMLPTSLGITGF